MVAQTVPAYSALDMARRGKAYNKSETVPGTLGDFIRRCRESLGLSQEEFADLVGDKIDATGVSELERGRTGLPKPPRMINLARALRRPVADLYVAAGFPEFAERASNVYAVTESGPDYDHGFEEFEVTEEEVARMRSLRERLHREWSRAGESARPRTHKIVVIPFRGADRQEEDVSGA